MRSLPAELAEKRKKKNLHSIPFTTDPGYLIQLIYSLRYIAVILFFYSRHKKKKNSANEMDVLLSVFLFGAAQSFFSQFLDRNEKKNSFFVNYPNLCFFGPLLKSYLDIRLRRKIIKSFPNYI